MKIAIIGAGNVASHLAPAFFEKGHQIECIFNRTFSKAVKLAEKCQSKAIDDLSKITADSEIYLIAVSDDAIVPVVKELDNILDARSLVMHTAGNVPSNVFSPYFKNFGVFYPLQSFVTGRHISLENVPLCYCASNAESALIINKAASGIFENIMLMSDEKRQKLHIPAVIVNNYINYLCATAKGYCEKEGLPYDLLFPLMEETMDRIWTSEDLMSMQTGPAIRGDHKTINRHLKELKPYPDLQRLYRYLARHISSQNNRS